MNLIRVFILWTIFLSLGEVTCLPTRRFLDLWLSSRYLMWLMLLKFPFCHRVLRFLSWRLLNQVFFSCSWFSSSANLCSSLCIVSDPLHKWRCFLTSKLRSRSDTNYPDCWVIDQHSFSFFQTTKWYSIYLQIYATKLINSLSYQNSTF